MAKSGVKARKVERVALAYSGGLDTSIIIPWLRESYGCEVVAMIGDVGQGDDYEGLRKKALATGASQVYVEDLREEFIAGYLWKALQAGAVYEGKYLLGTSLARPALAKRQVQVALATGADALAHGCTGKGNDQVRFELAYKALAPHRRAARRRLEDYRLPSPRPGRGNRSFHSLRSGRSGSGQRQEDRADSNPRDAEPPGGRKRRGPHRLGGEPSRRHQVARGL